MAAAAVVVWGSNLLRCGSDAAVAGRLATPARWAVVAAFSRLTDPDVGLSGRSGTSLQDGGAGAAKAFWVEGLADVCETVGAATRSVLCGD